MNQNSIVTAYHNLKRHRMAHPKTSGKCSNSHKLLFHASAQLCAVQLAAKDMCILPPNCNCPSHSSHHILDEQKLVGWIVAWIVCEGCRMCVCHTDNPLWRHMHFEGWHKMCSGPEIFQEHSKAAKQAPQCVQQS